MRLLQKPPKRTHRQPTQLEKISLFRGYKTKPIIMTPALSDELAELQALKQRIKDAGHTEPQEILAALGDEKYMRWITLEAANGAQSFTDDETAARNYAGEKGFVIRLEVPQSVITKHWFGSETVSPEEGTQIMSPLLIFSGKEVQELFASGAATLTDIQKERDEGKLRPEEPISASS